jgi:hypothetical protein
LGGGTNSNVQLYDNLLDGNMGACLSSAVLFEASVNGGVPSNNHIQVFNNVVIPTYANQANNGLMNIGANDLQFYNNTIIGVNLSDICFILNGGGAGGAGHTAKVENNLITGCKTLLLTQNSPVYSVWNYNIYAGCQPSGCNWGTPFVVNNSAFDTFSAWQAACLCDSNSVFDQAPSYPLINPVGVPQTGSPAIGHGANLAALGIAALNSSTSAGGTTVPAPRSSGTCTILGSSGCWAIGAFSGGSSPSAPSQLTVIAH